MHGQGCAWSVVGRNLLRLHTEICRYVRFGWPAVRARRPSQCLLRLSHVRLRSVSNVNKRGATSSNARKNRCGQDEMTRFTHGLSWPERPQSCCGSVLDAPHAFFSNLL